MIAIICVYIYIHMYTSLSLYIYIYIYIYKITIIVASRRVASRRVASRRVASRRPIKCLTICLIVLVVYGHVDVVVLHDDAHSECEESCYRGGSCCGCSALAPVYVSLFDVERFETSKCITSQEAQDFAEQALGGGLSSMRPASPGHPANGERERQREKKYSKEGQH